MARIYYIDRERGKTVLENYWIWCIAMREHLEYHSDGETQSYILISDLP